MWCCMCRSCQRDDGSEDFKKGTQLLEVYAVEIQMYTEQRNNKKLKQLYHKVIMDEIHTCPQLLLLSATAFSYCFKLA